MRCEHTQTDKAPIMMYNVIHYNAIYCHADAVAEYDDDVDGDIEITMRCDAMRCKGQRHTIVNNNTKWSKRKQRE